MYHGWQHLTPEDRETILRGIADGVVYGGPYHLEFDWVDNCNASCFFCNSAHIHDGRSIPWPRAERLLEEAADSGLRSIRLAGGGEPTLHPNFPDLLRLIGRRGIALDNLTTNGTMLTAPVLEALRGVRLGELRVSLNYADPAAYAAGMGLPERFFERAVGMIRDLGALRREAPSFGQLIIQFFVTRATARSIIKSYALARDLGADVIVFRELWGVGPEHYFTPGDVPEITAQMREAMREDWGRGAVVSQLESHGVGEQIATLRTELEGELGAPPQKPTEFIDYPIRYCYIGWYSMTVLGSQAVHPCCFLLPEPGIPPLGSLEQGSLGELWRGEGYAQFRREMRNFFLLQRPVPFFERRVKRTSRACSSHYECPITRSMCDEEFYREAERRLARLRARPGNQLWRLVNRAGRFFERKFMKK